MSDPSLRWVESSLEDSTCQLYAFIDFDHDSLATHEFICNILKLHHNHSIIIDCEMQKMKGGIDVFIRYDKRFQKKAFIIANDIADLLSRS